jgi:hypothetical protein
MSIYDKATLVQIPSGYKASGAKLYSVLPANGDGDFTVSADADATRVNSDGLIESTAANQARLSRNFIDGVVQPDPFLLLEPSRTNVITRSEEFNLWGDTGVTVTANDTIAPTGAQTADLLTSSANNWRRSFVYGVSNGTVYSFSCFVKKHTTTDNIRFELYRGANASNLDFEFSTETLSASDANLTNLKVENYPNDWYRVSCKFTANGTSAIVYAYPSQGYGSSGSAYYWGAQVEAGSYATSYIPTSGSSVTRTADTCKKINFADMPTDYPFTAFWQGRIDDYDSSGFTSQVPFSLAATGTFNCYFGLNFYSTSQLTLRRRNDSDNSVFVSFTSDKDTTYKIAICFISATATKIYINGTEVLDSTSLTSVPYIGADTPDSVLIGQLRDNTDTGKRNSCDQFILFNEALSNSELETITSYDSFGQMAKALLYTIE